MTQRGDCGFEGWYVLVRKGIEQKDEPYPILSTTYNVSPWGNSESRVAVNGDNIPLRLSHRLVIETISDTRPEIAALLRQVGPEA